MKYRKSRTTNEMRVLAHKAMCDELKIAQYETKEALAKRISAVCSFYVDPNTKDHMQLLAFLACRLAERIINA